MSISLIACISKNRGLGYKNQLLYKIPEDQKFFKEKTSGHIVIMGRNTFQSIGRPLPNRANIVITRDKNFKAEGCVVCHSVNEALSFSPPPGHSAPSSWSRDKEGAGGGRSNDDRETFIIGGAQIYAQTIDKADKLYLTIVNDEKFADAFFPAFDDFKKTALLSQDEYQGLKFQILELSR